MKKRIGPAGLLVLLFALTALAQAQTVKVNLHIVLVDRDLNQKPVPSFHVKLQRLDTPGEPIELKTGLDGTAQKALPAGEYKLETPQPIEFQGKRYSWAMEVGVNGAEQTIELTNDNAHAEDVAPASDHSATASSGAASPDLTSLFDRLKNSVVTVRAEGRDGSGFLVDSAGLVVTNNHVVESSTYLAVQFDLTHKVPARLLATNADKDIAVLWVNLSAFPQAVVTTLIPSDVAAPVAVGERVFTIGSPLGREKVLTTGVISKVETASITSDININPGNSGGPLFNLHGQVTGITRAGLRLLASIVPISDARPLIEQARQKLAGGAPPSAELLPVEPADFFPAEALRPLLQQEKMDTKPYFFDAGQFQIAMVTPPLSYFLRYKEEMDAARKAAKRSGGDPSQAKPPAGALEDAQDYRPEVVIRVRPKFGAFVKVRFKNGFQRMRLLCGGKEVPPIDPGRSEYELHMNGRVVDTTFQGVYSYPPDAITPKCGSVSLEIFSEKEPNAPITQLVETATVERIWTDLEPYRKAHGGNK